MNEDIKQLIEKESESYALSKLNTRTDAIDKFSKEMPFFSFYDIDEAFDEGANFILSKWQEAERWRSVKDELPEVFDNKPCRILLKHHNGAMPTYIINKSGLSSFSQKFLADGYFAWKPINDCYEYTYSEKPNN